jgi:hypothetical protein
MWIYIVQVAVQVAAFFNLNFRVMNGAGDFSSGANNQTTG